jgi:hypothetical protein
MAFGLPPSSVTPTITLHRHGSMIVAQMLSIVTVALNRVRDEMPPEPAFLRRVREFIREFANAVASLVFSAARFLRATISPGLAQVMAWASFLLAPGAVFAQAAAPANILSSFLPPWIVEGLSLLGVGGVATVGVLLIHKFAPQFFGWLATKEVPAGAAAVKTKIATSAEGMSHPEAVAIVNHQVDNLAGDVSAALLKAGADFANLTSLTGPSLLGVVEDAGKTFMAGLDEAQFLAALEALGQAEGGNVLTWVKKTILGMIHPVPAAPPTPVIANTKVVLTTPDGTKIVTSAADPSPGAAPATAAAS